LTGYAQLPSAGLLRRRAISIQAEGTRLLKKHAIAPSAARLGWARRSTETFRRALFDYLVTYEGDHH